MKHATKIIICLACMPEYGYRFRDVKPPKPEHARCDYCERWTTSAYFIRDLKAAHHSP